MRKLTLDERIRWRHADFCDWNRGKRPCVCGAVKDAQEIVKLQWRLANRKESETTDRLRGLIDFWRGAWSKLLARLYSRTERSPKHYAQTMKVIHDADKNRNQGSSLAPESLASVEAWEKGSK